MANFAAISGSAGYLTKAATTLSSTNLVSSITGKSAIFALNNQTPWQITSITGICTTTATVGNRVIMLVISDSNNLPVVSASESNTGLTQAASLTGIYTFAGGISAGSASTQIFSGGLPSTCIIPPNSTISFIDRAAIDVADTFTFQVSFLV